MNASEDAKSISLRSFPPTLIFKWIECCHPWEVCRVSGNHRETPADCDGGNLSVGI